MLGFQTQLSGSELEQHELAVPTLEDVRGWQKPAWLWDSRRGRIAWANDSGISFFGGETVFDVIDRIFDPSEPGIETISNIGRTLQRDDNAEVLLLFPSAGKSKPISCNCYVHALPDGRQGVLAVANETEASGGIGEDELAAALNALPSATILVTRNGRIVFANDFAKELLGEDNHFGLESELREFAKRLKRVGTVSVVRSTETAVGERDLRITARRLKIKSDSSSYAVVTLEDVTDRRELELQLTSKHRLDHPVNLEQASAKLTEDEAAAFNALGAALQQAAKTTHTELPAERPVEIDNNPAKQQPTELLSKEVQPPPIPADETQNSAVQETDELPALPPRARDDGPLEPAIPLFIRRTLDSFPGANLFVRNGTIVYANPAAVELLKHPGLVTLLASSQLSGAIAKLDGNVVELPCADGTHVRARVQKSQVPWINGPADRLTLSELALDTSAEVLLETQVPPDEGQPSEEMPPTFTAKVEQTSETTSSPTDQQKEVKFTTITETNKSGPVQSIPETTRLSSLPPPPRLDSIVVNSDFFEPASKKIEVILPSSSEPTTNPEEIEGVSRSTKTNAPAETQNQFAGSSPPPVSFPASSYTPDDELRAILDTAADGIITLDAKGAIRTLSAGAEAIFGYRVAEVEGKPLASLLAPESRKVLRDYLAALQGPGLASVFNDGREVTAIVKQGGEIPLFLTVSKMHSGRPGGAAFGAVVRDITQWKKTEAELREARDRAEQASRQKSEFLANISHELRTPLNAILGFSEMMRMGSFGDIRNEKYKGYVNDIHTSGAHLLSLINDLLDLSKVEAGKLELNFTSVNLSDVVDHCFKLVQELASSSRVLLRKNISGELPNVVADQRSMRQIVLNLLSNAIKFTDPGGQVIVSAEVLKTGELKFRVKDTGIGMNEEQLRHALEPFRRVTSDERDVEGTGLGLPLTKALAEANRTAFTISSEPRKGTLVEITFPTTRVLAE